MLSKTALLTRKAEHCLHKHWEKTCAWWSEKPNSRQIIWALACASTASLLFLWIHHFLAFTILRLWADVLMLLLSISVMMLFFLLITKTLRLKSEVEKVSVKDPLTGLYNRRFLEMQRDAIEEQARRTGLPYGVAMIDVDNLKPINDTFGHASGDRLLKEVAALIKGTVRKNDQAFRLGGDEFMIICFFGKDESSDSFEDRLRESLGRFPFREQGVDVVASASLGVAICVDARKNSLESVIHVADMNMYREKAARKR